MMIIQGKTVGSPRATLFLTIAHSIGAITVDIIFLSLYHPDQVSLFRFVGFDTHALSHLLNFLKSHFILLYARF
jgi:hypothetical protein